MFFEPVAEPVRPVRSGVLVTAVVALAAASVVVIGIFPGLITEFPKVSTLLQ
jgi:hypothetical protein